MIKCSMFCASPVMTNPTNLKFDNSDELILHLHNFHPCDQLVTIIITSMVFPSTVTVVNTKSKMKTTIVVPVPTSRTNIQLVQPNVSCYYAFVEILNVNILKQKKNCSSIQQFSLIHCNIRT